VPVPSIIVHCAQHTVMGCGGLLLRPAFARWFIRSDRVMCWISGFYYSHVFRPWTLLEPGKLRWPSRCASCFRSVALSYLMIDLFCESLLEGKEHIRLSAV